MQTGQEFQCPLCEQRFKRPDHLKRHRISHEPTRFVCRHDGCVQRFHREDVLKRHEKLHQPNVPQLQRRPRRGPEPKPFIKSCQSESRHSSLVKDDPISLDPNFTTSSTIRDLPLTSFNFCLLHFQQACTRRWSFIHHSSLNDPDFVMEGKLAMAALSGSAIAEYRSEATSFFRKAQALLEKRPSICKVLENCRDTEANSHLALQLFQTGVLLLEFALWHNDTDINQWAFHTTLDYATVFLPHFSRYANRYLEHDLEWDDWVYDEQCVRTLWAFYIITQKAMCRFPYAMSTLSTHLRLHLPQPSTLFEALDPHTWEVNKRESMSRGVWYSATDLGSVLQLVWTSRISNCRSLALMTPDVRHIVLVTLLETYSSLARTAFTDFKLTNHDIARDTPYSTLDEFHRVLSLVRKLWYEDSSTLFAAIPPRSTDLQNTLLMDYLEVLVCLYSNSPQTVQQSLRQLYSAARIACNILTCMQHNGVFEVATKAPWVTDGACRQHVNVFANVMYRWVEVQEQDGVEAQSTKLGEYGVLNDQLRGILVKCNDLHGRRSIRSDVRFEFKESVVRAWSAILQTSFEDWYEGQDSWQSRYHTCT